MDVVSKHLRPFKKLSEGRTVLKMTDLLIEGLDSNVKYVKERWKLLVELMDIEADVLKELILELDPCDIKRHVDAFRQKHLLCC